MQLGDNVDFVTKLCKKHLVTKRYLELGFVVVAFIGRARELVERPEADIGVADCVIKWFHIGFQALSPWKTSWHLCEGSFVDDVPRTLENLRRGPHRLRSLLQARTFFHGLLLLDKQMRWDAALFAVVRSSKPSGEFLPMFAEVAPFLTEGEGRMADLRNVWDPWKMRAARGPVTKKSNEVAAWGEDGAGALSSGSSSNGGASGEEEESTGEQSGEEDVWCGGRVVAVTHANVRTGWGGRGQESLLHNVMFLNASKTGQ